jgi:hypothetical protein
VTKVWSNCLVYNGVEHEIYEQALELAKRFDERFQAQIGAPQHLGLQSFPHGEFWIGHEVLVYWDGDHAWFKASIVDYLGAGSQGHKYLIQYPEDNQSEEVTLPDVNIALVDTSAAKLERHADVHVAAATSGKTGSTGAPSKPSPAHTGPRGSADRHAGDKQSGIESKPRAQAAAMQATTEAAGDVRRNANGKQEAGGAVGKAGWSNLDDKASGATYIGDDGLPCTQVRRVFPVPHLHGWTLSHPVLI